MTSGDIAVIATIAIGVFSIVGVNLSLFLYLANKIDGLFNAMNAEMKDFHGRLVRQDEAFKAHLQHHDKQH